MFCESLWIGRIGKDPAWHSHPNLAQPFRCYNNYRCQGWAVYYKSLGINIQVIKPIFFLPYNMRGFLIRLRYLGMCDIIVEHGKVKYLLYHAVSSISLAETSSIWLDISVLLLPTIPRDSCQIGA